MIRTQILLPPALYNQLKVKASTEGRSLSDLIRQAVFKMLKQEKKTGREILMEMAKHSFSDPNAPTDLSTNDEYLYGKDAP